VDSDDPCGALCAGAAGAASSSKATIAGGVSRGRLNGNGGSHRAGMVDLIEF
jgi:hypothetical protein